MYLTFGAKTKASISGTAAAVALPGTSGRFLITVNTDCFLRFDGLTASATDYDVFLPAGGMLLVQPKSSLDASVIQDTAAGTISVQEVE